MYSKFAIFAAISLSLVTVGYGSSISEVCAVPRDSEIECTYKNLELTKVECCWWTAPEDADDIFRLMCSECSRGSDGEWSCSDPGPPKGAPQVLPENLKDALDVAIEESENTTKVPETGVLDEPDALRDDEDESTENGDDTKVPKGPGGLNNDDGLTINPNSPN